MATPIHSRSLQCGSDTRIVIASSNSGKLSELRSLLGGFEITPVPQAEFRVPIPPETGLSFAENAILKARNACCHSGLPALADDSGIEVDALDGAPGIHSARFAGKDASDADNRDKLLREMLDVDQRRARFQCVLVLMRHAKDPVPLICQGTWEGRLLTAPRGEKGFGYDPIFYVPTHQCSAAELEPAVKNQLSHRGQALRILVKALSQGVDWLYGSDTPE